MMMCSKMSIFRQSQYLCVLSMRRTSLTVLDLAKVSLNAMRKSRCSSLLSVGREYNYCPHKIIDLSICSLELPLCYTFQCFKLVLQLLDFVLNTCLKSKPRNCRYIQVRAFVMHTQSCESDMQYHFTSINYGGEISATVFSQQSSTCYNISRQKGVAYTLCIERWLKCIEGWLKGEGRT